MRDRILKNWGWLRIVRLLIGGYVFYGGLEKMDYLMLFFGGLFLIQSIFNLGCGNCASGNCNSNPEQLKKEI